MNILIGLTNKQRQSTSKFCCATIKMHATCFCFLTYMPHVPNLITSFKGQHLEALEIDFANCAA